MTMHKWIILGIGFVVLGWAGSAWAWESNVHKQMVEDALRISDPEMRQFYSAYDHDLRRFFNGDEAMFLDVKPSCAALSPAQRQKMIEDLYATLDPARPKISLTLFRLTHLAADVYAPAGHVNCGGVAKDFYDNKDLNWFFIQSHPGMLDFVKNGASDFLLGLIQKDDSMAYIFSVNAVYRALQDAYLVFHDRAASLAPPSALYRIRVRGLSPRGDDEEGFDTINYTYDARGRVSSVTFGNSSSGGSTNNADGLSFISQCRSTLISQVIAVRGQETYFLLNLHNTGSDTLNAVQLVLDKEEYLIPVSLEGFSDNIVLFSIGKVLTPKTIDVKAPGKKELPGVSRIALFQSRFDRAAINIAREDLQVAQDQYSSELVESSCGAVKPKAGGPK